MEQVPDQENREASKNQLSNITAANLKRSGLFILILILLLITIGGLVFLCLYSQGLKTSRQEVTEHKKWVGIIETKEGLVNISPEGVLEKDDG